MKEHLQDILVGGRPMTKLELANKEIERLNNKVKEQSLLLIEFQDMEQRLKGKESIIKEAREYIESYMPNYDFDKTNLIKLLEILDKEKV